jgi:hypothetical protein
MDRIINHFQADFKQVFPNSPTGVTNSVFGLSTRFISFTLAQKEDYPNSIINNDPLHTSFSLTVNADGSYTVEHTQGALYVNPRERFIAMSSIKTRLTKKTGNEDQVIKHLTKWINKVKSIVVENKNDIYGGLEKYQKYIVE